MPRELIEVSEFTKIGIRLSVTPNQLLMLEKIRKNVVTFVHGRAGTGKSYVSVAEAIRSLVDGSKKTKKIIFVRAAVTSQEDIGFLPGTLEEKTEPYMGPLYAVMAKLTFGTDLKLAKKVETMTMSYMRGITFDDSFVILDEAQNTTSDQMKLFLSRIGKRTKVVVLGDTNQTDIGGKNGLEEAIKLFSKVPGIAVQKMTKEDNMRSPIVDSILRIYEGEDEIDDYIPSSTSEEEFDD